MKNKKIVVFLLIAVMVLGFTLTALVGCKDWKDVDYEEMTEFLNAAVENTAQNKNINNLKLGALMTIDTTYGDSKKTYTIDINAALALDPTNSAQNQASLEIKDVTSGKNVVSAYYHENDPSVYLLLGENKYKLNAFAVKKILEKNNASVSNDDADAISSTVTGGISDFLDLLSMVVSFDGVNAQVSKKGTSYRLSINLGTLLNGLLNNEEDATIPELVGGIVTTLGLDVEAKNLAAVLPALELGININVSSKKAEEAVITGITADLSCPAKNIEINKKEGKGTLLKLNIANDFTATANIDLKFGDAVNPVFPADYASYPAGIGAINLSAKGSLTLKQGVENVSLFNILNINVPAGTYDLELAIAADPAKLVNLDFTGIHSLPHAIDKAIEAVNSALDYLNVKITKDGADFLQIELAKNTASGNVEVGKVKLDALGIDSSSGLGKLIGRLEGMSLVEAWSGISGLGLFTLPAKLDPGYVYANDKDYKDGYAVDTANGYVDANKDGEPDRDKDGNLVVGADFELYKGVPTPKAACGYVKDEAGNWKVDTEHGYRANSNGSVRFDSNGDFAVANGYVLYKGRPMLKADYDALPAEDKEEQSSELIPSTVKDLIDGLSIVAENGQISIKLSDMGFKLGESETKDLKLSATLGLDKTGININAEIKGLNNIKIKEGDNWVSVGLPELLQVLVNIKFTDISYGTAGK
ncbi:MAG: hypothetical protein K2O95_02105 [Clostridia bacterium]|nr:hypothetical protein [Clostridia bacterium]